MKTARRYSIAMVLTLVVVRWLAADSSVSAVFEPVRLKSHRQMVRTSQRTYTIDVGGTVDMENKRTPYALCGGRVHARLQAGEATERKTISISLDGNHWRAVWTGSGEDAMHPAWLRLDQQTGLLTGIPERADVGVILVTVVCHRTFPRELKRGDFRSSYQASWMGSKSNRRMNWTAPLGKSRNGLTSCSDGG